MKLKKLLSFVLAIAMVLSLMPVAFAAETDTGADTQTESHYVMVAKNAEGADGKYFETLKNAMLFTVSNSDYKYIKLLKDTNSGVFIDIKGTSVCASGVTFDLDGHTLVLDTPGGSKGTGTNGFRVYAYKTYKGEATVKNGTVEAKLSAECPVKVVFANYGTLTLENVIVKHTGTIDSGSKVAYTINNGSNLNITNSTITNTVTGATDANWAIVHSDHYWGGPGVAEVNESSVINGDIGVYGVAENSNNSLTINGTVNGCVSVLTEEGEKNPGISGSTELDFMADSADTLKNAAAVAPSGSTIILQSDVTADVTLPTGVTLDKNGYEVTGTVTGGTVTDSTVPVGPALYTITKASCENGKVTAQAVMASAGSTIKVAAVPAEGYKVASLTVTDASGNEIEVVDGKIKMPASNITVSAVFMPAYIDIDPDNEHLAAICYMYENGLMVGTSTEEYIFDGEVKMTRSQIAMILYNLADEPETAYTGVFTDAPEGAWYTEAVEWAASKGIMVGVGDGAFAHNRQITVVEMAALIYRYAQCQMNGQCESADWATESAAAMTWCVENGILAEGTVSTDIADRYLAADVFYSVYNLLNK